MIKRDFRSAGDHNPLLITELVRQATDLLRAAGVDSARVDAELLLAGVLGTSRSSVLLRESVPVPAATRFAEYVARRADREPLQHILGEAPFRHVVLAVGPGVFVPRPETELLVDAVLPHLHAVGDPLVVDLCSGSGALAVAVADEVPGADVVAVEHSPAALRWLVRNATPHVRVLGADVKDPELLRALRGRVDVVVCNPPYVPSTVEVTAEVRADPTDAVFAGMDGLELIPTVIERARQLLAPGGAFVMEHDESHAAAVVGLLAADAGWTDIADHPDLTGRPRYVIARRAPGPRSAD